MAVLELCHAQIRHEWFGMVSPESVPENVYHTPALVDPVIEYVSPAPEKTLVDATCGTGGHSVALMPRLLPSGRLICADQDAQTLAVARERLRDFGSQIQFIQKNFRDLPAQLEALGIPQVDGLLLDLGMSSWQLEHSGRGFSFRREEPLDMRMDAQQPTRATDLVNALPAADLARLLQAFGEERFARRIAQRIVRERALSPIHSTTQLAQVIARAVPGGARHGRLHPATRTFQALRIAVNEELAALETILAALPTLLAPRGRAVILSFHSLEDRMVKQAFQRGAAEGMWTILTKKPVRPTRDEVARNPRARSVKLRAVERSA